MRGYAVALGALALLSACANPEDVKQLQEANRALQAKVSELEKKVDAVAKAPPGRPQVDPNKVYDIPVGNSPFKGPANAPVVLVEWADYQCPFCAQVPALVDQLLAAYPNDLKFVYKQMPLPMHSLAMPASKAALAAGKQGKYWEMHALLYANQRALQPDKLKGYAEQLGLDVPKWEQDMASPEIQQQIDAEMAQARQAQVSGTPSLFINGKRAMNRSVDGLKQAIDEALKAKG